MRTQSRRGLRLLDVDEDRDCWTKTATVGRGLRLLDEDCDCWTRTAIGDEDRDCTPDHKQMGLIGEDHNNDDVDKEETMDEVRTWARMAINEVEDEDEDSDMEEDVDKPRH
ncbi:hypothetical protein BDZ89DRAFT_1143090 [Hymenopellis radicata]|nr:hypothetical protein BDZ89DRAFT_1143090 [Hymenopellis radicata]